MVDLKKKAYDIIKERILSCEMAPGEIIDQKALIDELGFSRTPLRDALGELAGERLVEIYPRRGVFVSDLSYSEVNNIYIVRKLVEPYIVKLVTPTADRRKLEEFREIFSSDDYSSAEKFTVSDFEFHEFLVKETENDYLISMMDMILCHNRRFTTMAASLPKRLDQSNREHMAIVEAMLAGDADKASKLMTKHIEQAMNSSKAVIIRK